MIIFKFQEKEYTFSGFSAEANYDGEMLFVNGDLGDYQFSIEIPGSELRLYTKSDEGMSMSFDLPDGESFASYNDDGSMNSSIELSLKSFDSKVVGSFQAMLIGEDPDQPSKIEGNFSLLIQ